MNDHLTRFIPTPAVVAVACVASFVFARQTSRPPAPQPAPPAFVVAPLPTLAPPVSPVEPCPPLDLDGDGRADLFDEVVDSCGTGGCVYRVTLTNANRYAGKISGHCPFTLAARPDGPADVVATWRLGVDEVVTRYRFTRGTYRAFANGAHSD